MDLIDARRTANPVKVWRDFKHSALTLSEGKIGLTWKTVDTWHRYCSIYDTHCGEKFGTRGTKSGVLSGRVVMLTFIWNAGTKSSMHLCNTAIGAVKAISCT